MNNSTKFVILISFLLIVSVRCQTPVNDIAEVYISSRDGDRLTKSKPVAFIRQKESSDPVINVDESIRYQRIDGFGATFNEAGMICLNSLEPRVQEGLLKNLFDSVTGAGFSLMKSPIAACDFASAGPWYSYNEHPGDTAMEYFSIERDLGPNGLIPFIKKASQFGKFDIESPMDFAPDWIYFAIEKDKKHIRPEYYKALAKYYSKYLKAYSDNGIKIGYLNLFNEGDNHWYSNVTYKAMGEMIKNYVVPRLKADGINVRIQLGETSNRPEALKKFPAVLEDPEVRKYIHSLTVHGYDWDKFDATARLHEKYPDLPVWMTEVCYVTGTLHPRGGPDKSPVFDFSDGEFWGNMIVNDMKNWVSGWIYWNMILDQDGGPWLVSVEHGDPVKNQQHPIVIVNRNTGEVTYTGLYYYLSHFSRFVRPGAYRIECNCGTGSLNMAGFQNPEGELVLNVVNNGSVTDGCIKWDGKSIHIKFKAHSITTVRWNRNSMIL
jgi:glucosylceramidase